LSFLKVNRGYGPRNCIHNVYLAPVVILITLRTPETHVTNQ
jgi:hypothetical protein